MKVRDLCICDVAACGRETSLARAGTLMRRYNVGVLPVVDPSDRVVGMVTDRDIALELTRGDERASDVSVEEIMAEGAVGCTPEDDVRDVLDLMAKHRVRRVPVTDEEGRLQGIVSIDDIVCHSVDGGDGRSLPYVRVMETLDSIAHEYQTSTGRCSYWNRGRDEERVPNSSRKAGAHYYRSEAPEFPARYRGRAWSGRLSKEEPGRLSRR